MGASTLFPHLSPTLQPRIFVAGDLNVDYVTAGIRFGGISRVKAPCVSVGGSGFNAAVAFKRGGFQPIVFGKVGADANGDLVIAALDECNIERHVIRDERKTTCTCNILHGTSGADHSRTIYYLENNANDYDPYELRVALAETCLGGKDLIFVPLHIYDQTNQNFRRCQEFFQVLRTSGARMIIDIVPHDIYQCLNLECLQKFLLGPVFAIVAEWHTLTNLVGIGLASDIPTRSDFELVCSALTAEYYLCRYGVGNISRELIFRLSHTTLEQVGDARETGYEHVPDSQKAGFGDRLTCDAMRQILTGSAAGDAY